MELRDFIVTPLLLIVIYMVAYWVRPYVTDATNYRYYLPGLTLRILGAIAVGIVYQFYYTSGDTFMYHTNGSRLVWETFIESPWTGLKLLFASPSDYWDLYTYSSRIYFFRDPNSYAIIRMSTVFDLLTFSSYSA